MKKLITLSLCTIATAALAGEAVKPFNGKNLDGWKQTGPPAKSHLTVGTAKLNPKNAREFVVANGGHELINAKAGGIDFYSEAVFGDAIIEVEVMVPQGSNSGVYVMGEYEIQVLDSFGRKKLGGGDMGAIYGAAPPRVNACKKPGQWQKYEIHFLAPRFKDGKKTANARATVRHNGVVIHDDIELPKRTTASPLAEGPEPGFLHLQDHGNPVRYRNIWVVEK